MAEWESEPVNETVGGAEKMWGVKSASWHSCLAVMKLFFLLISLNSSIGE